MRKLLSVLLAVIICVSGFSAFAEEETETPPVTPGGRGAV